MPRKCFNRFKMQHREAIYVLDMSNYSIFLGQELSKKIVTNQEILHFSTPAKAFRDVSALLMSGS